MKNKLSLPTISFLIFSAVLLSACVKKPTQSEPIPTTISPTATPSASQNQEENVSIVNFTFSPANLIVRVGTTVTWTNKDLVAHTATAVNGFDSGFLEQGESYSFTFNQVGIFDYICTPHPYMQGNITVVE